MKRYVCVVKMVKPFIAVYPKRPTKDMVLEALMDAIELGKINDSFEVELKITKNLSS